MDILRNLFGALTSGIIRLLVSVGIIAAVYFFIVRPVLDTTGDAIKEANKSLEASIDVGKLPALPDTLLDLDSSTKLSKELQRAYVKAQRRGQLGKLNRCIQRAQGDVERIQRCARRV